MLLRTSSINKYVLYQVLYFCGCEMNVEKEPDEMRGQSPQHGDEFTVNDWNFSLHVVSG